MKKKYFLFTNKIETLFFQLFKLINLKRIMNIQFITFCIIGKLKEAQQYLLDNPTINISADSEYAFRYACCNGHLLVAQWLLLVKPDINISAYDEEAFHIACLRGHLLVAQWLQSLKPNLYVINYNNDGSYKGYYIRSKEEARWEQRKYLVWLASDQSPNKKSLFYRIPQDVSRYIISNYL
jgi:ankyrin repeat protein